MSLIRRLLGLPPIRTDRTVPLSELIQIVRILAPSAAGVMKVPWGSERDEVLAWVPHALRESLEQRGAMKLVHPQAESVLEGHPVQFTFIFGDSGLWSVDVSFLERCPSLVDAVTASYGAPTTGWNMGTERHVAWERPGFEIIVELTPAATGGVVMQLPNHLRRKST